MFNPKRDKYVVDPKGHIVVAPIGTRLKSGWRDATEADLKAKAEVKAKQDAAEAAKAKANAEAEKAAQRAREKAEQEAGI